MGGKKIIPRNERTHGAPVQLRASLSEHYETQVSGREGWWRDSLKTTPLPGAYEPHTQDNFLRDLHLRKNSYRFKSTGREQDPSVPIGKGKLLLPGAYNHPSFLEQMKKNSRNTYSFKNTKRNTDQSLNFGVKDKNINVPPNTYLTEKYLTIDGEKTSSKHAAFKSQSRRFPTVQFVPRIGPPPGNYDHSAAHGSFDHLVKHPKTSCTTSSFKSSTPRFITSHTQRALEKNPGPGAYTPCKQFPLPPTVAAMGRNHGVFFTSCFHA